MWIVEKFNSKVRSCQTHKKFHLMKYEERPSV